MPMMVTITRPLLTKTLLSITTTSPKTQKERIERPLSVFLQINRFRLISYR